MAARGTAQDVVSWYLTRLDPQLPHPKNIQILRGPVIGLTSSIIESYSRGVQEESTVVATLTLAASEDPSKKGEGGEKAQPSHGGDEWKNYINDSEREKVAYETLGRRTKARMEAFLSSISFAVPVDSTQKLEKMENLENLEISEKSTSRSIENNHNKVGERDLKSIFRASQSTGQSTESTRSSSSGVSTPPHRTSRTNNEAHLSSPVLTSVRKTLLRQMSNQTPPTLLRYRQISREELLTRLELYIRSLHRVRTSHDECVVAVEPARAIKARVNSVVMDFTVSVGCVRRAKSLLTTLLTLLTKELLAVDTLAEDLTKAIRRIVSEYEHSTSFASLAFLSSPEVSAETVLTPLILRYAQYLQSDWKNLIAASEMERLLSQSLDQNLRHLFKTIEFQSIGHLLEVCQHYREDLRNIQLTPDIIYAAEKKEALSQAVRDLQREVITVNGHVLPPVVSRHDLVHLLSQTLNSRLIAATMPSRKKKKRFSNNNAAPRSGSSTPRGGDISSSGCDGDSESDRSTRRRRNFHLSTIDMLTKRLLLAASRTGTGGDAFFVVRDLFGGDEVEVVPSKSLPTYVGTSYRSGSIDLSVRLGSLTIKCHGSFDVYPKSLVRECEPLIQLHTTVSETIHLQEVRASDTNNEEGVHEDDVMSDGVAMVVQERITPKTGWRTLSIRPALYEKVQEWDTPS